MLGVGHTKLACSLDGEVCALRSPDQSFGHFMERLCCDVLMRHVERLVIMSVTTT